MDKIARKIDKLKKLEQEFNETKALKAENERKMKLQLDQLQENYRIMSDAYVKERKLKEQLASQLEEAQAEGVRRMNTMQKMQQNSRAMQESLARSLTVGGGSSSIGRNQSS